jgi:TetR/AcrR family transcriptional repressor of bet genes
VEEPRDERRARGARSRQAILRAALTTLADKGLEGFTARSVAEHAGVSTATLFHHFASLDELQLEAMMLLLDAEMEGRPALRGSDAKRYLRSLGELVLRVIARQPELMRTSSALLGKLPFSEALQRSAARHYERYVQQIESELAALVGAGRGPPSRRHLALAVVLMLDGMGIYWTVNHDVDALRRFWTDMVALFAPYLEAPAHDRR